jgi:hypothetical protein
MPLDDASRLGCGGLTVCHSASGGSLGDPRVLLPVVVALRSRARVAVSPPQSLKHDAMSAIPEAGRMHASEGSRVT